MSLMMLLAPLDCLLIPCPAPPQSGAVVAVLSRCFLKLLQLVPKYNGLRFVVVAPPQVPS